MKRHQRRWKGDSVRITAPPIDLRLVAMQRQPMVASAKAMGTIIDDMAPTPVQGPPVQGALVQSPTSMAVLLATAASDPQPRRRQTLAAAAAGLNALEGLHKALSIGQPGAAALRAVTAWMGDHVAADDSDAAGLLHDVELRVLVELAKAEHGN
jgi:Class II flagellar assembly regulator